MVENLHQKIFMSAQKDSPQDMVGNQHKSTSTSHPQVDEKFM
jgi:hypothetical protein